MDVHYHVGHNVPGCSPEHDVTCVNTPQAALAAWRADFRDALNAIRSSGVSLRLDTRQSLVTPSDVERSQRLSLSMPDRRRYWIERVTGAYLACPAHITHTFHSDDDNPGCDCGSNDAVARLKGGELICAARAAELGLSLPTRQRPRQTNKQHSKRCGTAAHIAKDLTTAMDDIEHIFVKYTRLRITWQALDAARDRATDPLRRTLPEVMIQAAYALISTETTLTRLTTELTRSLKRVTDNLTAGPEDQVYAVTSTGELQGRGVLYDAHIARRDAQIQHLRTLVVLWNADTTGVATLTPAPTPAADTTPADTD